MEKPRLSALDIQLLGVSLALLAGCKILFGSLLTSTIVVGALFWWHPRIRRIFFALSALIDSTLYAVNSSVLNSVASQFSSQIGITAINNSTQVIVCSVMIIGPLLSTLVRMLMAKKTLSFMGFYRRAESFATTVNHKAAEKGRR